MKPRPRVALYISIAVVVLAILTTLTVLLALAYGGNNDRANEIDSDVRLIVTSNLAQPEESVATPDAPRNVSTDSETSTEEATLTVSGVSSEAVTQRASPMVYVRRQDLTGYQALMTRFRCAFHSMVLKGRHSANYAIWYGQKGVQSASVEPPYVYDTNKSKLRVMEVEDHLTGFEGELDLACSARFLEFTFKLPKGTYRMRVNISYEQGGEMGDVLLWDDDMKKFMYYDPGMGFSQKRPFNPVSMVPNGMHEDLRQLAREYAVMIPVIILNRLDPAEIEKDSLLQVELIADPCVLFTRRPPADYSREWIMEHVALPDFTSALSGVLTVL